MREEKTSPAPQVIVNSPCTVLGVSECANAVSGYDAEASSAAVLLLFFLSSALFLAARFIVRAINVIVSALRKGERERKRERERERERKGREEQGGGWGERERDREIERERERERARKESERTRERENERTRERESEKARARKRESENARKRESEKAKARDERRKTRRDRTQAKHKNTHLHLRFFLFLDRRFRSVVINEIEREIETNTANIPVVAPRRCNRTLVIPHVLESPSYFRLNTSTPLLTHRAPRDTVIRFD